MADAAAVRARGRRPGPLTLLVRQFRYQDLLFWRNPFAAFFTIVFPMMFLLLFNSLNDGSRLTEPDGILKRLRGTPMPAWVYVAGRVVQATWAAVLASILMVVVGVLLFHVKLFWHLMPAAIVTMLIGTVSFCALGLALAAVCPNGETAPAMANFTWLPIAFISPIFYPLEGAPAWLQTLGNIFPVKHFAVALQADFSPFTHGSGFRWGDLGVIALWALGGTIVATRRFQWEPRAVDSGRSRGVSGNR